jgi:hypothetical protein
MWIRRSVAALAALWAARAAYSYPRNAVVIELVRSPGCAIAPYWARLHVRDAAARPLGGAWFVDRRGHPDVPPSGPPLVPDPIVILVTIDAMRADVLDDARWRDALPTLRALRGDSVDFALARATGSQTVYTIATLFAGTHFSQQSWTRLNPNKLTSELWPHADPTVRFPERLRDAGVPTVTIASAWWLVSRMGIVRGFGEETKATSSVKTDYGFPLAADVMAHALARLEAHGDGPLFLYLHFMEPHAPYTRGGVPGTPRERWVAEIGMVDQALRALIELLERRGLWARTVLVVTSDHGEAFGEHGQTRHGTTLYEELLRVPLFIRAPGVAPRVVAEPVSTIDLGPTILDVFGLPAPGHVMGESLGPFLRGRDAALSRPIAAETRLMQALVTRDGIKAIRDLRLGTLEAYDLAADAGETRNIIDTQKGEAAMNELRLLFQVHTYRDGGYQVPYRP